MVSKYRDILEPPPTPSSSPVPNTAGDKSSAKVVHNTNESSATTGQSLDYTLCNWAAALFDKYFWTTKTGLQ